MSGIEKGGKGETTILLPGAGSSGPVASYNEIPVETFSAKEAHASEQKLMSGIEKGGNGQTTIFLPGAGSSSRVASYNEIPVETLSAKEAHAAEQKRQKAEAARVEKLKFEIERFKQIKEIEATLASLEGIESDKEKYDTFVKAYLTLMENYADFLKLIDEEKLKNIIEQMTSFAKSFYIGKQFRITVNKRVELLTAESIEATYLRHPYCNTKFPQYFEGIEVALPSGPSSRYLPKLNYSGLELVVQE